MLSFGRAVDAAPANYLHRLSLGENLQRRCRVAEAFEQYQRAALLAPHSSRVQAHARLTLTLALTPTLTLTLILVLTLALTLRCGPSQGARSLLSLPLLGRSSKPCMSACVTCHMCSKF